MQDGGRHEREVRAKVVVDASGQSALITNRFKLRVWDPVLNKGAIWTYWEGAYRDTGRTKAPRWSSRPPTSKGWFWYIPLHDNIVSVGVVAPFDYLFKNRGRTTSRSTTRKSSAARPSRSASPTADACDRYFATKDYSYRSKQVAGDGWVLVGDAFGFLDPLYSSGVLLALQVGRAGGRRDRRGAGQGRHVGGAARQVGAAVQRRRGPHAPAGLRVLRRLQLRQVRPAASRSCKGTVTDLLIGDLFNDASTRSGSRWSRCIRATRRRSRRGTPEQSGRRAAKANELFLPEAMRP